MTSEPPTIAVAIDKSNYTHTSVKRSRVFAVSVLSRGTPLQFIENFGFKSVIIRATLCLCSTVSSVWIVEWKFQIMVLSCTDLVRCLNSRL